jgi:NAD(P)-dependent dehydrogenase (short-subunit alcohol dehydrogenase family)
MPDVATPWPDRPRVAIVTGAANGIGAAVARRLVADGYVVAGLDVEPVSESGVRGYEVDCADVDGHEALVARIEAELGPVYALANVAGTFVPERVEDLTLAAYRRQLGVMLDGPVWLARAAGTRMAARGEGRIVNVTSVHASVGEETSLSYDAAKAGLEAATRTLAIELGPRGVLVNSIAPGFVRTRMSVVDGRDELESEWFRTIYLENRKLPLRRAAEPEEIAGVVAFLLSPDASYVHGHRLVADGGLTVTF